MRKIIFLLALSFLLSKLHSQKNIVQLKTNIKEVTVFLSGAQVERTGTLQLSEGNYYVQISGLPDDIETQTIQVNGKGDFSILSVSTSKNYLTEQQKPKEATIIEDSIQKLKDLISEKNYQLFVYNQEEALILANKELGGSNTGVNVASLKEASDFVRNRLMDIKTKQLSINKQISEIQKKLSKLENQLNEINNKKNLNTTEITVYVFVNKPTQATFNIKYITNSASWYPSYDLKTTELNKPLKLIYKANIQQNTGENWDNVKLIVSTANPFEKATKPSFKPWFLTFYEPYYYDYQAASPKRHTRKLALESEPEITTKEAEIPEAARSYEYITKNINVSTIEFTIQKPYDVNGNGQILTIELTSDELPGQFEFYAYPKVNQAAFLIAKVTGWENLNILPGDINLFFENTYIGKTSYTGVITSDTLEFSLGQDKAISIKREKIKEYTSKKIIGLNQRQSLGYSISVRNNKNIPITITLQEQLPISTNKDIEIEKIETSNAIIDETTGSVTWKFELKPGESKELKFIYAVKYPKNKTIILN